MSWRSLASASTFLVGLEFRSDDFRANAPSAVAVSISGIVVPFLVAIAALHS
jgi:Kef-type K+ transport system membrane component KefB